MPTRTLASSLGPLGAALPQAGGESQLLDDHTAVAVAAETSGYRSLWVSELTSCATLDPLLLLSHVAAVTNSTRLGVAVILAPLHSPVRLANQLATLDVLSGGRLVAGVGFGSRPEIYPRFGLPSSGRLSRYLDGLDLVQELWTRDHLAYDNGLWQLAGPTHTVKPRQTPRPPILLGARHPSAVERCARIADGWLISGSAPAGEVTEARRVLERSLADAGRVRDDFVVAQRVYVSLEDDRGRGQARMRSWFAETYGNPDIADRSALIGSDEDIVEAILQMRAAGTDHVIVNPVYDEVAQLEAIAGAWAANVGPLT